MLTLVKSDALLSADVKRDGVFVARRNTNSASPLRYLQSMELVGWFDSTTRFMNFLQSDMSTPRFEKASSKIKGADDDFNAFTSFEEALDIFVNNPSKVRGYDESDVVILDGDNAGNSAVYDVTGDFLDVGRYLEGEPECFGIMTDGNPRSWRVNLFVNIGWWCAIDHNTIVARSRQIQRLIDWLESQHIRTSVLAVSSNDCGHIEIMVKDHDQVLDMNDVAIVSHPEFLRRMCFRFKEYSPTVSYGYGNAHVFADTLCAQTSGLVPDMYNEVNVFIDSRSTGTKIAKEFFATEKWLTKVLGDATLEPEDRCRAICRS
jgi:hypothetical protein